MQCIKRTEYNDHIHASMHAVEAFSVVSKNSLKTAIYVHDKSNGIRHNGVMWDTTC
jgi:hypothetical protein